MNANISITYYTCSLTASISMRWNDECDRFYTRSISPQWQISRKIIIKTGNNDVNTTHIDNDDISLSWCNGMKRMLIWNIRAEYTNSIFFPLSFSFRRTFSKNQVTYANDVYVCTAIDWQWHQFFRLTTLLLSFINYIFVTLLQFAILHMVLINFERKNKLKLNVTLKFQ